MKQQSLPDYLETAKSRIAVGEYDGALIALSRALNCNPDKRVKTEIYYLTALCRYRLCEFAQAGELIETALDYAADQEYANRKRLYELLGKVCEENQDYTKLESHYRLLLAKAEDKKDILADMLQLYEKIDRWDRAAEAFDEFRDVELDAASIQRKITCFTIVYRIKEAFQAAREYAGRFGEDDNLCARLMLLYYFTGDAARGFEYYKKAVAKNDAPKWRFTVGRMLLSQDLYHGAISDLEFPAIIADMRRNSERLRVDRRFKNTPKPFRKIRLGYLSANLMPHPVGYFLLPVMENTFKSHSFIKCYSLISPKTDINDASITAMFRTTPDAWADVQKLPDADIEQMFLDDSIDIVFDMMCHTPRNRLWLFARRLAPVQISWIGFPVTTAVADMDYVIADRLTNPPGAEKYYTERLLYMPDHYLCHTLEGSPRIEAPAFTRNGYITFACFHNLKKITDKTLGLWRRILERTENSVLKVMGQFPEGVEGRNMIEERFRKNNMPMDRVILLPMCSMSEYLDAYNGVDIMLDTYPFSGATTTFDALRMGRPIITLAGERHVTRVSFSILKKIGYEDITALTEEEYVDKAVGLANDPDRLRRISRELPGRLRESPLTDQNVFRKNYETIIRDAWITYCADNRMEYDYSADSLPDLAEQVINATVYFERKLEAAEEPAGALLTEYQKVQKAFYEKLKPVINNENIMIGYGNLVKLFDRGGLDAKNFRLALAKTRRYLNMLS